MFSKLRNDWRARAVVREILREAPGSLIGVIMAAAGLALVQESHNRSDERFVSYDGVVVLSLRLSLHSPCW